jgi:hydroxymethylbilane synthase
MADRVLVGTRGSALALAQTNIVLESLRAAGSRAQFTVVPIKTSGDLLGPRGREGVDGKTAFTGEIEKKLVEGTIDFAVHSLKDLPTKLDERLVVAATPHRGDPRDALISTSGMKLSELKAGARVGTSSARRKAQLLAARRDLKVVGLNGNVETRVRKLQEEHLDAVVLAAAGLERVGLGSRITHRFGTEEMVPAVGQGTLAVEASRERSDMLELLRSIDDPATRASSECERAFSDELGGDCFVPLGAFAESGRGRATVTGMLADPDGETMVKSSLSGKSEDPAALGRELAARVRDGGGDAILRKIKP